MMSDQNLGKFIVVAGNIGAGKTTLAQMVANRFGWQADYESVSDNPYLEDFYKDQNRWVFNLAVYNLGDRILRHRKMQASGRDVILDRSIYEDRFVFVEMFHETKVISERDYKAYTVMWDLLVAEIPVPDLLVFINAPVNTLVERIGMRNRSTESAIPSEYLHTLNRHYMAWINAFSECPVLHIDGSEVDFLANPNALHPLGQILDQDHFRL
jgi:deoxyadenosine/deoxycytidine kinase